MTTKRRSSIEYSTRYRPHPYAEGVVVARELARSRRSWIDRQRRNRADDPNLVGPGELV
jgi:hypothetical protein